MTRILVVENEGIIAKDLQRTLREMGHEVPATARHADEAVRLARQLEPELILMDIHLADGSLGTDAAVEIHRTLDAAIVFLTAYADETTLGHAQDSEPYGYLVKPFDEQTLRTTIATAVHKREADRLRARRLYAHEKALEQLHQAVLVVAKDSRVELANRPAREIVGRDPSGERIDAWEGVTDQDGRPAPEAWEALVTGEGQARLWTFDDKLVTVSAHTVEDVRVLVLLAGDQRQSHARTARQVVSDFQARARELI